MRRSFAFGGGIAAALALLAACAAPATPGSPTPAGGGGGVPTIGPTQAGGGGGGGGGGTGGGAVLSDGQWTSGNAHLVVTGGTSGTYDLALEPLGSLTGAGSTLLQYASTNPTLIMTISIDATSTSVAMSTGALVGGAGTTSDSPCQTNYAKADASSIQATMACQNATVMTNGGAFQTVNFQISFTAAR